VRQRGCQAFVVLTICRLLYSLETGSVGSKPAAACWAVKTLGSSREALIRRAVVTQDAEQEISDTELKDTLEFLSEALNRIKSKQQHPARCNPSGIS
jgi:hypothetical protein